MSAFELLAISGVYMALLFAVAWRSEGVGAGQWARGLIYALSLMVYCTSWTFFGAVGTASRSGWSYLPIYIGPVLALTVLHPLWMRVAQAAKRENVGSIADFLASRYGKSLGLGRLVAVVALAGALPYVALQLRSLSMVVALLTRHDASAPWLVGVLTVVLGGFAILFGARRVDLTEHNPGLMRAIAVESLVKLFALVAVAGFALALLAAPGGWAPATGAASALLAPPRLDAGFLIQCGLATAAFFCLPRQFLTGFVELGDVRDARWAWRLTPVYLLLTSLAVIPLSLAGLGRGGAAFADPDVFVLALPFNLGQRLLTALVYVGGFSAASGMIIVETVALSAMTSNQLILPSLTRRWRRLAPGEAPRMILAARRASILAVLAAASLYAWTLGGRDLASIGLISFTAAAQLAPALLAAVTWRGAHARGAVAGIGAGALIWAALLVAPQLLGADSAYARAVADAILRATGLDPLSGAALISLAVNTAALVAGSLTAQPRAVDRIQAQAFVDAERGRGRGDAAPDHAAAALQTLVANFVGRTAAERGFREARQEAAAGGAALGEAGLALAAERILAGAIGASTARRVVAEALTTGDRGAREVARLIDSAGQAVQFNRELLQSTIDHLSEGVCVIDAELRLVAWNRRYLQLFALPADLVHVGLPIGEVIRFGARLKGVPEAKLEAFIARRLDHLRRGRRHSLERVRATGETIRSTGAAMPGGGYLTSFTDVTALRRAVDGLRDANEGLEARVVERTAALAEATQAAEAATESKTRYLAAASHDVLQPLHAARLFLAALEADAAQGRVASPELVRDADLSVASAHRLLRALLNLSRLEAGGVRPALQPLALQPLFDELRREFAPQAAAKGLALRFRPTRARTRSDPDLLRSVLQNLVSNAIRYTDAGGVLVGVRLRGPDGVALEVSDTGRGLPAESRARIFEPFERLGSEGDGVGLGLAIVARVADLLGERVELTSRPGRGSTFRVTAPRLAQAGVDAPAETPLAAPRRGLRVLCVDNEPAVLRGLSNVLSRLGAEVCTARDAEEAGRLAGRFDLALVDYHLDAGDGVAVLRRMDGRIARQVIVTADASEDVARRVRRAGAALVHKPIPPEVLKALLAAA